LEEPLEGNRIHGVEDRGAPRAELARGPLQALWIAAGEDQVGSFGACSSCRFKPDAGAPADHDDGLPEQLRLALRGRGHTVYPPTSTTALVDVFSPMFRSFGSAIRHACIRRSQ